MIHKFTTLSRAVLLVIFASCLLFTKVGAADLEPPTIFFPLKINAQAGAENLVETTDRLLGAATTSRGMVMLGRNEETVKLLASPWPPPPAALSPFFPAGFQGNVTIGSLTKFGDSISLDLTVFDLNDPAAPGQFYKNIATEDDLAGAIEDIAEQVKNFAKRQKLISAVKITGNTRIDSGAIYRKITSRPGDELNIEQLRKDLKEVFALGYFGDIQILTQETPSGHEITFAVQERELIDKIEIVGNDKLTEEDIREVITLKSHSIISDIEIKNSLANVRNLYREDGYLNCRVEVEQTAVKKDRVNLTFRIEEGKKIFIKEINFTGNKTFPAKLIKKAISTSEKGWLSFITESGLMNKQKLEQDATRIAAFYQNHGFVDVKIGDPEITQEGDWFYVSFNINEGERYACGVVSLTGDLIADEMVLQKLIQVDKGDFFSQKTLREDVLRLTDFYAERGYAFAEIDRKSEKHPAEKTVDISLRINKGQLVTINRINISGNTRTRDKVIRREILLEEGGLFNAVKLKTSNQKLGRIDYFEDVNISPEPGIDESELDLNVKVKEKPTGKFSIGGGYSTVDSLIFMGEISENNLFGRGHKVSVQANISGTSDEFKINFTEPRLFDTKIQTSFSIYNWTKEYDDYTKDSEGAAFSLGYPLWEKWRMTVGLGYDDTQLSEVDLDNASQEIIDSMDYHVTNSTKVAFSRDTRDRLYGASNGSIHTISTKYAGGPLGGDNSFTKVEASTSWYFPISENTTFHPKFSVGYIAGNSEGHLPVFEKFYLGGLSTIRAFENGYISPYDPESGDLIGGDKMWFSNFEYIFPLAKSQGLSGVLFYDIGNVFGTNQRWQLENYKHSTGAGIRWMSPIGPLSLMWGYNLDPVDDEDTSNWEFSIGGAF